MSKMLLCKFEFEPLRANILLVNFGVLSRERGECARCDCHVFLGSQMNRIARRTLIDMLVIAILAVLSMKSVDRYRQSHHANHVTTAE